MGRAPVGGGSVGSVQLRNTRPEKLAVGWEGAVKLTGELR